MAWQGFTNLVLAHPCLLDSFPSPPLIQAIHLPLPKNSDDVMARGVLYYIFRRPRFCCCLPVRVCVIIMSVLGILLAGVLSVVCWFEVSRTYYETLPLNGAGLINPRWGPAYKQTARGLYRRCNRRNAFLPHLNRRVCPGLHPHNDRTLTVSYVVRSLIGSIVRKLTFVTAYTIGLYIHFFINLIVAAYLFYVILHATHADTVNLCQHALKNAQSQGQCESLFSTIRGVYAALASFVLIVELCECTVSYRS